MKISRLYVLGFTVFIGASSVFAGEYKVQKKVNLGGEGGWDYLTTDTDARRLYISHGKEVLVLNLDTQDLVGTISDTPGVHGIAIVPSLGRGFISCGGAGRVDIFELATLKKIGHAAAGNEPDAIMFDPSSNRVFAFNGQSSNATAIDASSGVALGTIPLTGGPEFAVANEKGSVFVNIEDKNSLAEIDAHALTVKHVWPIEGCEDPSALAIDLRQDRLFAGCRNKTMAVINPETGKVVGTLPIGGRVDAAAFDADRNLIFFSNGDGTLTEIQSDGNDHYHVVANIQTQRGARTVALDPKSHRLFLPTAEFGAPPAPTADRPHPRPAIIPGSFTLLVVGD